jgi:hypothetical protein
MGIGTWRRTWQGSPLFSQLSQIFCRAHMDIVQLPSCGSVTTMTLPSSFPQGELISMPRDVPEPSGERTHEGAEDKQEPVAPGHVPQPDVCGTPATAIDIASANRRHRRSKHTSEVRRRTRSARADQVAGGLPSETDPAAHTRTPPEGKCERSSPRLESRDARPRVLSEAHPRLGETKQLSASVRSTSPLERDSRASTTRAQAET